MANRLIVVLSQSPNGSSSRRDFEENIAAALMMEEGIDVNIVPHLEALEAGSTGLLCLEGIRGDLALLSWLAPHDAVELLNDRGIEGRLGSTSWEQTAASGNGSSKRTVYAIDLGQFPSVVPVIQEIRRIRDDQRVQTFDILGVVPSPRATEKPKSPPVVSLDSVRTASGSAAVGTSAVGMANRAQIEPEDDEQDDDDRELEDLIDELDTLDL